MEEEVVLNPGELRTGLRKIRLRRWFLWLLILAYLPLMIIALGAENAKKMIIITFGLWVLSVIIAVALMALARCPRCGYCFHMSGYLFRPVRRCFECDLHLTADKHAGKNQAGKGSRSDPSAG